MVRLSALGDIVHAVPVLSALTRHDPSVEIDWLVEGAYAAVLDLVDGIRQRIVVRATRADAGRVFRATPLGYLRAVRFLRTQHYDVALDLQGLIKSAGWARASGARRVIGFSRDQLREPQAARLYTETVPAAQKPHVIYKNLAMAEYLGAAGAPVTVRLATDRSPALQSALLGVPSRYAVLNPGAAWPNKRWPAVHFAAVARHLAARYGMATLVTWGPAERVLAEEVVVESGGTAQLAPATTVAELAALVGGASLVVSGDTGPMHLAAAAGAPIVGLFGPTWPERNGPWDSRDEVISRATVCRCHHKRQCLVGQPCIDGITVDEVTAAVDRRLAKLEA